MPRNQAPINALQFTSKPQTVANPDGKTGTASVSFVVGVRAGTPLITGGVQTGTAYTFTPYPQANQAGVASVTITATDTLATTLPKLLAAALAAEGLTLGTDAVLDASGTQLA